MIAVINLSCSMFIATVQVMKWQIVFLRMVFRIGKGIDHVLAVGLDTTVINLHHVLYVGEGLKLG